MEWQSFVATIVAFFFAKRSISSRTEGTIFPPSYPSLMASESYSHSKAAAVFNEVGREEVVLAVDQEENVMIRNRCEVERLEGDAGLLEQIRVFFVKRHEDEENSEEWKRKMVRKVVVQQTNPLSPTDPQSPHSLAACTA